MWNSHTVGFISCFSHLRPRLRSGEEAHRGEVPSPSHRTTRYQHALPVLMVTFVSCLRCVCHISPLLSSSFPPPPPLLPPLPFLPLLLLLFLSLFHSFIISPASRHALFGSSHFAQPTSKEWGAMLHLLRAEYLHKWEICLFYLHSFIYSLICV